MAPSSSSGKNSVPKNLKENNPTTITINEMAIADRLCLVVKAKPLSINPVKPFTIGLCFS